jgi:hypothetical protein
VNVKSPLAVSRIDRVGGDVRITGRDADSSVTEQEINRAVQYVTASTSYARETVAEVIRTGLEELAALATQTSRQFEREALLEYVCQWTIKRTKQPEPLVREILSCAGRWLDELYDTIAAGHPEWLGTQDN